MNGQLPSPLTSAERHRGAQRYKTFEPTTVRSDAGEMRAHVLNVSITGALLHMADPPKRGSAVSIDLGSGSADARVIWTKGSRLGVAFRSHLAKGVIDLLLRE